VFPVVQQALEGHLDITQTGCMEDSNDRRHRLRQSPIGSTRFLAYPWAQLLTDWVKRVPAPYQGQPLTELEMLLDVEVLPFMLQQSRSLRLHDDISDMLYVRTLYNIRMESLCFGAFVAAGRETFAFSPGLASELRHTDIRDARLDMLRLPYPAFFVHFGRQHGIEIDDDQRRTPEIFDGAFVWQSNDGTLQLALTFSRADGPSSGLAGPVCLIGPELLSLPADDAVRRGLERCATESLETQLELVSDDDSRRELEKQVASFSGAVEDAANLVVNSLFYLTSYGGQGDAVPEPSTPQLLAEKLQRARNAKQQREARNAIQKAGFTLVRLCGADIPERSQERGTEAGQAVSAAIRAHWRRGHWRNQRYGQALSLEKLIWVRPTLVAAGRESIEGRTYAVQ